MKKKIFISLFAIVALFTFTGCNKDSNKTAKSNYKSYECKYSKDENTEGKRYLTKYVIKLNNKNEAEVYTLTTGFSNYGSETDGYKDLCKSLKENKQTDLLEKYKDVVSMNVVCDKKNNYEVYAEKTYQIKKIKDITDFSNIYKFLEPYIKDDGTFDLDGWKNYFNTDSLKAGNYTCNF